MGGGPASGAQRAKIGTSPPPLDETFVQSKTSCKTFCHKKFWERFFSERWQSIFISQESWQCMSCHVPDLWSWIRHTQYTFMPCARVYGMARFFKSSAPDTNVFAVAYAFSLPGQTQGKMCILGGKPDGRGIYLSVFASGPLVWILQWGKLNKSSCPTQKISSWRIKVRNIIFSFLVAEQLYTHFCVCVCVSVLRFLATSHEVVRPPYDENWRF